MTDTHRPLSLLAAAATIAVLLLSLTAGSAQAASQNGSNGTGNTGTIKVHDEETASPATRNEPHVDCDDFWIEGFKMKADSGTLTFFSWPPTGDKAVVLEETWAADGGTPKNHFLEGPFTLTAGHYRVEASDTDKKDGSSHVKTKVFWVEPCEAAAIECPADLQLAANNDGTVTLTFTPVEGSDGTNVYRADGDGDFVYLATVPAGVGEYTDHSTLAEHSYAYTVTTLSGNQESEGCAVAEATTIPDLPTPIAVGLATGGGVLALALGRRRKP